MKGNILKILAVSGLIISCSPANTLFVKNNTNERLDFFVELKEKTQIKELLICKELVPDEKLESKAFINYYKEGKCYHQTVNAVNNKSYKFTLPVNYTVNIAPNNSVYPFNAIYYMRGDIKCFINTGTSADCRQKTSQQPGLVNITEILE